MVSRHLLFARRRWPMVTEMATYSHHGLHIRCLPEAGLRLLPVV